MTTSLIRTAVSSLTLAALALSATPAAALGMSSTAATATSVDAALHANASHVSVDSSTDVDSHLSVKRSGSNTKTSQDSTVSITRCTRDTGDDREHCEKVLRTNGDVETKSAVSAAATRSGEHAVVTAKARIEKMLTRIFGLVARTAKRVCVDENDSSAGIRDCMADIKSHVQARVSAMIEVAFAI